jgi:hypothetical protein
MFQQDHIMTLISFDGMAGFQFHTCQDYLRQFPMLWEEWLKRGYAQYFHANGKLEEPESAILQLKTINQNTPGL